MEKKKDLSSVSVVDAKTGNVATAVGDAKTGNATALADRKIDTVLFDLDGTLLNTLQDMADSVNYVMSTYGFKQHSVEDVRSFIGNGIRKLLERALTASLGKLEAGEMESFEKLVDEATARYREYYQTHCMIKTAPYDGIMELMQRLKAAGIRTGIVTNKNDDASQKMFQHFFADTAGVCYGQRDDIPKKPHPTMIDMALAALGSSSENAVYVGDSEVDMQTAANAGMPCITCCWGFRDRDYLAKNGAYIMVEHPSEISNLIL